MYCSKSSLFAVIGLALTLTFAIFGLSYAQRSDDGIGAGSGNSPPIDEPRGRSAMPDAATQMKAPPMPTEGARQVAPEASPDQTPPETTAPDDSTKKEGPPDPD
jgi:hypothetical protein